MSRDGFATADIDVRIMHDPKTRALVRQLADPVKAASALMLYISTVVESYAAGHRVSIDDAAPMWWMEPLDEYVAALIAVGLIDSDTRTVPDRAWVNWYGPALDRRLSAKRGAIYGGLVRQGMSPDAANAETDRRISRLRTEALSLKAEPEGSASSYTVYPAIPSISRAKAKVNGADAAAASGAAAAAIPVTLQVCPRCDQPIGIASYTSLTPEGRAVHDGCPGVTT